MPTASAGIGAFGVGGGKPAANPTGRIAGGNVFAEEPAFDAGFGIEMAAGGVGQARGVDQGQIARIVKIGQRRKGLVKAEIDVGYVLFDGAACGVAFARHAQIFGAGGDEVFIGRGADKAKAVGTAAQEQNDKDGIMAIWAPIATGIRG